MATNDTLISNKSQKTGNLIIADEAIKEKISKKILEDPEWQSKRKAKRKEHLQGLFLYPAMMITDKQRDLISLIMECQPGIKSLFDGYMGSASSLLAGLECGLDCYGQDINPLAVLLSQVKLSIFRAEELYGGYLSIKHHIKSVDCTTDFPGIDKWFKQEVKSELSAIQAAIRTAESLDVRRFMWIALAETIRLTSNDRISTYKLHRRKEEDIERRTLSPISTFDRLVKDNIRHMAGFHNMLTDKGFLQSDHGYTGHIQTTLADSKLSIDVGKKKQKFDLLVTSPPYGDNKSTIPYGQHSYLPLQWIDLDDIIPGLNKDILQSTHQLDYRSIGGSGRKLNSEELGYLLEMSPNLKVLISKLEIKHADKINKVLNFFFDIEQSFTNIAEKMAPNSYNIWTVGNRNVGGREVKNDLIMRDFLEAKGFIYVTKINRHILNKKMPSKNNFSQTMKTEKILIFRKRG